MITPDDIDTRDWQSRLGGAFGLLKEAGAKIDEAAREINLVADLITHPESYAALMEHSNRDIVLAYERIQKVLDLLIMPDLEGEAMSLEGQTKGLGRDAGEVRVLAGKVAFAVRKYYAELLSEGRREKVERAAQARRSSRGPLFNDEPPPSISEEIAAGKPQEGEPDKPRGRRKDAAQSAADRIQAAVEALAPAGTTVTFSVGGKEIGTLGRRQSAPGAETIVQDSQPQDTPPPPRSLGPVLMEQARMRGEDDRRHGLTRCTSSPGLASLLRAGDLAPEDRERLLVVYHEAYDAEVPAVRHGVAEEIGPAEPPPVEIPPEKRKRGRPRKQDAAQGEG